jgi:DnaJ domain
MAGDASAYAALGVEPGADSRTIEQAYKRLIKEHHPDREGGDARRAAEINRAYRELRAARSLKDPLELNEQWPGAAADGRGWAVAALIVLVAVGLLLLLTGPLSRLVASEGVRVAAGRDKALTAAANPMDQPLHLAAIDGAAQHALHLARTADEMALASASRDCHHQLRSDPSLLQLDRCAAFDEAVVQLEDRDPLRDQGPFSELAVTGRIWSGAAALSDDSVAIDGRLDRIRLRVEVALAPAIPPAPSAN